MQKKNKGFSLIEMIITISIMAILLGLVAAGLKGYIDSADTIERTEVAQSSYFAVQNYIALEKRKGNFEEFTDSVKNYNNSHFGSDLTLTEAENRVIIEANYEGADFSNYYQNDYLTSHANSRIVCLRLDAGNSTDRQDNPLYKILNTALKDQDVMQYSFIAEFDADSGIVRSVFFSKDAASLGYHFDKNVAERQVDGTDIIERSSQYLAEKKQGYFGVMETAGVRDGATLALIAPDDVVIVNEDRLYVTWSEANLTNTPFLMNFFDIDALTYTLDIYDQDNTLVAEYSFGRDEVMKTPVGTGTIAEFMDTIDDTLSVYQSTDNSKQTRIGGSSFDNTKAMYGVAEERYFVLLECLDHLFEDNGYDMDGETMLYAVVTVGSREVLSAHAESEPSDMKSAYFADVIEPGLIDSLYTYQIAFARHLYNMRQGLADGKYIIVDNINWDNIEMRARDILFDPIVYTSRAFVGVEEMFTGELDGKGYTVFGLKITETICNEVGLLRENYGAVKDLVFEGADVNGTVASNVGVVAGINNKTIDSVTVKNSLVKGSRAVGGVVGQNANGATLSHARMGASGQEGSVSAVLHAGGVCGENSGIVTDCYNYAKIGARTYDTRSNYAAPSEYVHVGFGGIAGYQTKGQITDCINWGDVELVIYNGNDMLSYAQARTYLANELDNPYGVGGIIGYNDVQAMVKNCYSTVDAIPDNQNGIEMYVSDTASGSYVGICVGGIAGYSCGEVSIGEGIIPANTVYTSIKGYSYVGGIVGYQGSKVKDGTTYQGSLATPDLTIRGTVFAKDAWAGGAVGCISAGTYDSAICNKGLIIGTGAGGVVGTILIDASSVVVKDSTNEGWVIATGDQEKNAAGGGIVGCNFCVIENCTNIGTVTSELAFDRTTAIIPTGYASIGGVSGKNGGQVKNCHSLANAGNTNYVSGSYHIGGLVGENVDTTLSMQPIITDTMETVSVSIYTNAYDDTQDYNKYNVIGGIVAQSARSMTLKNFTYAGSIFSNNQGGGVSTSEGHAVGGIIGYAKKGLVVENCHLSGNVYSKGNRVGGLAGYTTNASLSGCSVSASSTITGENYVGGYIGLAYVSVAGTNTLDSTEFKANVTGKEMVGGFYGYALNVEDRQRINYGSISGTKYTGGVFGVIKETKIAYGLHKNLGQVTGVEKVGGIAGGMISYEGTITDWNNEAQVSGTGAHIGGVIGTLYKSAIVLANATNCASVKGDTVVGGLVGYGQNNASVILKNCKNTKTTDEDRIFAKSRNAGGLLGAASDYSVELSIQNSSNDMKVDGYDNIGGFVGMTTALTKVTDSVNEGIIGENSAGTVNTIAGFVALSRVEAVTITNCVNKGDILHYAGYYDYSSYKGAGGFVGYAGSVAYIDSCVNEGKISLDDSENKVASVGGLVGRATNVVVTDSTNKGDIYANGPVHAVAGLIGTAYSLTIGKADDAASVCENYGNIYVYKGEATRVSGGIGNCPFGEAKVYNCINYGNIENKGDAQLTYVGGIMGYLAYNENHEINILSEFVGCKQLGSIKGAKNVVGGILGRISVSAYVENCINGVSGGSEGSIELVKDATNAGGIIGYTSGDTTRVVTMSHCVNYANISGDTGVAKVGGIIGGSGCLVEIGKSSQTDSGVTNYGNILSKNGGILENSGGIIGNAACPVKMYYSKNYGALASPTTGTTRNAGGIIGSLVYEVEPLESIVENCTNYGTVYSVNQDVAYGVGGIIGLSSCRLTVKNCQNGEENTDKGRIYGTNAGSRIGGIVGSSKQNITLTNCTNFADITLEYGENPYVGGITGVLTGEGCTAILDNCVNLGQIKNVYSYSGGLIGCATCTLNVSGCVNGKAADSTAGKVNIMENGVNCGGLIGSLFGKSNVTNCRNFALVTMDDSARNIGGIVGYINGSEGVYLGEETDTPATFVENYGNIQSESDGYVEKVGGIVGCVIYGVQGNGVHNFGHIGQNLKGTYRQCGGIIGYGLTGEDGNLKSVLKNCKQSANIYNADGSEDKGGCGGIIGICQAEYVIENCENGKNGDTTVGNIYLVDEATKCGGIVAVNLNKLTVKDSVNYGSFMMAGNAHKIGGIVGYSNNSVKVYGCTNYADMTCPDTNEMDQVGGIVGYLTDSVSTDNAIELCTSFGNFSKINGRNNSIGAGGIIGYNNSRMTISQCVNKGTFYLVDNAYRVGGIVGYNNNYLTMDRCENYGDIISDGAIEMASGAVAYNNAPLTIGKEDGSVFGFKNYGHISGQGDSSLKHISGGIAFSHGTTSIYDSVNYGNFAKDDKGLVYSAGGFIGNIDQSGNAIVKRCTQEGSIYHVKGDDVSTGAGGIVGFDKAYMTVEYCTNNGDIYLASGAQRVGGIMGSCYRESTIKNCTNNGDVVCNGAAEKIGGILGNSGESAVCEISYVENHGTVTGTGDSQQIGGIVGSSHNNLKITFATNHTNDSKEFVNIDGQIEKIGGIVGLVEGSTTVENAINYGNIIATKVISAGGIFGQSDHSNGNTFITACTQDAMIDNVIGATYSAGAGNIVGFNKAATIATDNIITNACKITGLDGAIRIGGFAGAVYKDLTIENTINNSTLLFLGNANYLGGVTGIMGEGADLTVTNVTNNAILVIPAGGNFTAGLVGSIESDDSVVTVDTFTNNGLIRVSGNAEYLAGFIGKQKGTAEISNSTNNGSITNLSGSLQYSGGLIGRISGNTTLTNLVNNGMVTIHSSANNVGGIVGLVKAGSLVTVDDVTNRGALTISGNGEKDSGFVGCFEGGSTGTIHKAVNSGAVTIHGNAMQIGGIVGQTVGTIAITESENNADLLVDGTAINSAGVVGHSVGSLTIGRGDSSLGARNSGNVTILGSGQSNIGGVVGHSEGKLTICRAENTGNISTAKTGIVVDVGGVCGHVIAGGNSAVISSSVNYGSVTATNLAGGIIGLAEAGQTIELTNCYALGGVTTKETGSQAGSLVGSGTGGDNFKILDCYGDVNNVSNNTDWGKRVVGNYATAPGIFNGGTSGIYNREVYNNMCTYLQIANQWNGSNPNANIEYLMLSYIEKHPMMTSLFYLAEPPVMTSPVAENPTYTGSTDGEDEMPQETQEEEPEEMPQESQEEEPEEMPQETQEEEPDEMPQETQEEESAEVPQETPETIPEEIPSDAPVSAEDGDDSDGGNQGVNYGNEI